MVGHEGPGDVMCGGTKFRPLAKKDQCSSYLGSACDISYYCVACHAIMSKCDHIDSLGIYSGMVPQAEAFALMASDGATGAPTSVHTTTNQDMQAAFLNQQIDL